MRASTKDLVAALTATGVGGLLVFLALGAKWNPQDMNPGVEGSLCAGVLGTVLALLAPLPYRVALLLTAPVVLIEALIVYYVHGPTAGVVGLHLLIVGFIGLGSSLREPREPADQGAAEQG